MKMIKAKIENQARALELLKLPNANRVKRFATLINYQTNVDAVEAGAAKEYFSVFCPDINRREESPMNSRLNYGYSIIRNSIIRAAVAAGLLPSFGIHHQNLFNAYNCSQRFSQRNDRLGRSCYPTFCKKDSGEQLYASHDSFHGARSFVPAWSR